MLKKHNTMINWDEQKRKLKNQFSSLTEKDLQFEKGKLEEMLVKLQDKVGKTRHELYQIMGKL